MVFLKCIFDVIGIEKLAFLHISRFFVSNRTFLFISRFFGREIEEKIFPILTFLQPFFLSVFLLKGKKSNSRKKEKSVSLFNNHLTNHKIG